MVFRLQGTIAGPNDPHSGSAFAMELPIALADKMQREEMASHAWIHASACAKLVGYRDNHMASLVPIGPGIAGIGGYPPNQEKPQYNRETPTRAKYPPRHHGDGPKTFYPCTMHSVAPP